MKAINFKEATLQIAENQPEYITTWREPRRNRLSYVFRVVVGRIRKRR
jgi:hypothetical protein